MAKWKLSRQTFGSDELNFSEGDEVTIGRGLNNTVTFSSIVISRNHCVLNFKHNEVTITDLKSSNGIYVGLKRIPANIPYKLKDSDVIGFGWTIGAPLVNITDSEKYVFKLTKESSRPPLSKQILFQNDCEYDDIAAAIASLEGDDKDSITERSSSPVLNPNSKLKRKLNDVKQHNTFNKNSIGAPEVINILSDSDIEMCTDKDTIKKIKLEQTTDEQPIQAKCENHDLQYEAFNVKQEYLGYDDEAIQIDSDSDSESEHWFLRLSQSSPGKPFTKIVQNKKSDTNTDCSYSQADDFVMIDLQKEDESEEELADDLFISTPLDNEIEKKKDVYMEVHDVNELEKSCTTVNQNDIIPQHNMIKDSIQSECVKDNLDVVDGESLNTKESNSSAVDKGHQDNKKMPNKIQIIEPLVHLKKKSTPIIQESKKKQTSKQKSSSKKQISNSQKEERKKKLKEIASKGKEDVDINNTSLVNSSNKQVVNAKVTTSNRGAFLIELAQATVKPSKKRPSVSKTKETINTLQSHEAHSDDHTEIVSKNKEPSQQHSTKQKTPKMQNEKQNLKTSESDSRIPLKAVKPLTESDDSISGKPFSKVEPFPLKPSSPVRKSLKKVRFTNEEPKIHVFEIEPGNKLKKTSSIKTTLLDIRHLPVFSLEKLTLMKILCWNPHWLEEQINNKEPPPILGHNNPPMAIFHSFNNHKQYIQMVGDLLLMEIWECLSQGFMRLSNQGHGLQMRIDSLPPTPPQERCFDLFNLSVNISLPSSDIKSVPRIGELLIVTFGPENAKVSRFLFVHNVRSLPSPQNNIHSFFTISLYATFTDKLGLLRPGEILYARSLAYINKELMLFEAMEHLAGSPLCQAILKPEPRHFIKLNETNREQNYKSQWTMTLNPSQRVAVSSSVAAALGDKPCIQMVQGPPGTGKSSVICAIVMTYFYNAAGKKQQNRGKILICATSNAAVDELVIRLLNIRQSLPKTERFRMVRVGRAEAMHPRARDVSSQQLAQRDAARVHAEPTQPGLAEEISHLEAKINMWRTQAQDAKDPVRVAYCQSRIDNLLNRINLIRGGCGGGGDEVRPEQVAKTERRIIEGADIVVTTLASAHNHKMRGLRGRIALCIVDEAGQAIEPETLIPLTLDVTRLTLIGDPQQLPGFICSQRAKQHGLGESLFSRLTSSAECWREGSPVVLLNQQYRMQPDIADFPNRAFYGGRIQSVPPPRTRLDLPPYCILTIASGDKGQGSSGANEMEAWGAARVAAALWAAARPLQLSLAVITPYSAHRDLLRRNLRLLHDSSEGQVEVNTVDSFQGQERDVVVVSLARSHGVGFLTDAGRMNVMLTRARHSLVVCLNPLAVTKNHQWRTLIDDAHKRKVYRVLPSKLCQSTSSPSFTNEEILKHIRKYSK